ncbi:ras-related protein Rab-22A-like [Diadema antillarum]|uniref:ras-related protein Rab-22A-like n=1 Tax=Diadema antillarum TaxID=105358 RepID=UPI003A837AC8
MKALEAKVVILGKEGVGKTSIVVRYVGKIFSRQVSPTVGASFFTFKMNVDNHRVKLQLWDTAGQERFRSMAPMYYRKSNAAFLVYDITDSRTFENMKLWSEELEKNIDGPIVICVLGNKCDLADNRQVSAEEGLQYAASIGALFFETSALKDEGVSEAFLRVALALISLAKSTSASGMTIKDYDTSRRQSADITAFPAHLQMLREKAEAAGGSTFEEEEEGDDGRRTSCCSSLS